MVIALHQFGGGGGGFSANSFPQRAYLAKWAGARVEVLPISLFTP
jgi:hypothetical protein